MHLIVLELSGILVFNFLSPTIAECPDLFPIEIEGRCYAFQSGQELLSFKDASDNCGKKDENGVLVSVRTNAQLDIITRYARKFVINKLKTADFWIGLFMKESDAETRSKPAEDRIWTWSYDGTEILQKDYTMWKEKEGPNDKKLKCATISTSSNYSVKGAQCAGPYFLLCMMKEGESCTNDVITYMMFGDYCIGGLSGALRYDMMLKSCSPGEVTPYNEGTRKYVEKVSRSVLLGGGIFMNMTRNENGDFADPDGWKPPNDWWEEGEPRNDYDCVGLIFQSDWSLKLKAMNCKFMASSVCILNKNM